MRRTDDGSVEVDPRLVAKVTWLRVNLLEVHRAEFLGRFDVILCRNVLIYFDDDTVRAVVEISRWPTASGWGAAGECHRVAGPPRNISDLRRARFRVLLPKGLPMSRPRIRVLVVDDSAFSRKVIREVLSSAQIDVVGIARDGLEALEKIAELKPDVLTLDLMMPNLDGIGVMKALPSRRSPSGGCRQHVGGRERARNRGFGTGRNRDRPKAMALATDRLSRARARSFETR